MFAQVIQGRTSDAKAFRTAMDKWMRDLAPGADGLAREHRRRDRRRPRSSRWHASSPPRPPSGTPTVPSSRSGGRRRPAFDGDVTFADSEDVTVDLQGDPDRAGFVQIMRGRVTDAARGKELMERMNGRRMAGLRPDVLGSLSIGHEDGAWTQVIYFTSEAEAREGERKEMPPEVQAVMAEMMAISAGPPEYFDLRGAGARLAALSRIRRASGARTPPGRHSTAPEGRMFLLVLAVPGLLVVLVGYVLGHAVWGGLTPFPSGAAAGWITGVLLLVATVRLVLVRRRRPGR